MNLRDRLKHPEVLARIGFVSIAASGLLRLFEHPTSPLWRDRLDGATGFLTGVAIGTLLMALWKRRHQAA
jgi:hypothetical protein